MSGTVTGVGSPNPAQEGLAKAKWDKDVDDKYAGKYAGLDAERNGIRNG